MLLTSLAINIRFSARRDADPQQVNAILNSLHTITSFHPLTFQTSHFPPPSHTLIRHLPTLPIHTPHEIPPTLPQLQFTISPRYKSRRAATSALGSPPAS